MQDRVGDAELAEVVQHAGGLQAVDARGARPSAAAVSRANCADGARVLGRAGVAQVERLGEQHRGREAQLGRLAGRRRGARHEHLLERERGVVGDRHQRAHLVVGRPPAGERLVDETMPSTSPVAPRSGSSSMSSGSQASGPSERADSGV